MGAEVVDRRANVRLLRDNGQLACVDAEVVRGIILAPRPRIYIDVLSDRRGEDIAQHFRGAKLGY